MNQANLKLLAQYIRAAVVGFSRKTLNEIDFGNSIKVILVPEFVQEVTQFFTNLSPMKSAVPEGYPLLRAIQFAVAYGIKSK